MFVRQLTDEESKSLRTLYQAREAAEVALKEAIAALPQQSVLASAKKDYKSKCAEISQGNETFSDDFRYAVTGVIRMEETK